MTPQTWSPNTVVSWQLVYGGQVGPRLAPWSRRSRIPSSPTVDQLPPAIVSLVPAVATGSGTAAWSAAGSAPRQPSERRRPSADHERAPQSADAMPAPCIWPRCQGALGYSKRSRAQLRVRFHSRGRLGAGDDVLPAASGVQDLAGNTPPALYLVTFTPAVPHLAVTGITLTGTSERSMEPRTSIRSISFPLVRRLV